MTFYSSDLYNVTRDIMKMRNFCSEICRHAVNRVLSFGAIDR